MYFWFPLFFPGEGVETCSHINASDSKQNRIYIDRCIFFWMMIMIAAGVRSCQRRVVHYSLAGSWWGRRGSVRSCSGDVYCC